MAENSHISWTDNTFNYWIGCTKVSAGCDNCYAEREQDHRYGRAKWGKGNERYLTSDANRRRPFQWNRQAEKEGRRIRVFTASLSDVFDEEVSDEWRHELFTTIRQTPHLDWLVLTKRLAKMRRYVAWMIGNGLLPSNVWWGCSVENQPTANQRIGELLQLRQYVGNAPLWLSVEPLIGSLDLTRIEPNRTEWFNALTGAGATTQDGEPTEGPTIDWVVVGGESGPGARPMHPGWPRVLRDQCIAAGVPFHFKQWGEWIGALDKSASGWNPITAKDAESRFHTWPDRDVSIRVGKKVSGRLLDGREWNEFPKGVI